MLAGRDPQREGCGGAAELSPSTWSLLPSPRVGESSSELFWGQTAAELVKQRVKKWEGGLRSPLCVSKVKSTINSGNVQENRKLSLCLRHSSLFTLKIETWKRNCRQLPFSFLALPFFTQCLTMQTSWS